MKEANIPFNEAIYTALITSYLNMKHTFEAEALLNEMRQRGLTPNSTIFT